MKLLAFLPSQMLKLINVQVGLITVQMPCESRLQQGKRTSGSNPVSVSSVGKYRPGDNKTGSQVFSICRYYNLGKGSVCTVRLQFYNAGSMKSSIRRSGGLDHSKCRKQSKRNRKKAMNFAINREI